MENEGWEKIYAKEGEIFSEPLPKIIAASRLFKKRGYIRILDLGCGTGRHSIYLAQQGFSVYATDISKTGIEILKKNAKTKNLSNIRYAVHDMTKVPYEDNFFDAIICVFAMGHGLLDDAKKTIDEMFRVLKPQGTVITEFMSVKDKTYGKGEEIEKNTFIGSMEGEEDIPHHYFSDKEINTLFSKFSKIKITPTTYFDKIEAYDAEAIR
ncbi:MAG: class I SAM-dependent methyltransferase [Candidatus Woesearchaeota archaeon]